MARRVTLFGRLAKKDRSPSSAQVNFAEVQVAGRSITPWCKRYGRWTIVDVVTTIFFARPRIFGEQSTKMMKREDDLA